jgi:uncharacterized protein YndB with AHSA1/START domain
VQDRAHGDDRRRTVDHRSTPGLGGPPGPTRRHPERGSCHGGELLTLSTVSHDTFVIERLYDVPVAQVFGAWADPTLKARWFAGSADALGAGYELDFRVGGRETNRGGPPDGPIYRYESEYRDIVPDQRIVYTYEMHVDETRMSVSVATIEFRPHKESTQLVLTEQGAFLDGHDTVAQREEGTRSLLESLASVLSGAAS